MDRRPRLGRLEPSVAWNQRVRVLPPMGDDLETHMVGHGREAIAAAAKQAGRHVTLPSRRRRQGQGLGLGRPTPSEDSPHPVTRETK